MYIPPLSEIRPHEKLLWNHHETFSLAAPYKLPNGQIVCGIKATMDLDTTRWNAKFAVTKLECRDDFDRFTGEGGLTREDAIKWIEDKLGDKVPTEEWKTQYCQTFNDLRDKTLAKAKERGQL